MIFVNHSLRIYCDTAGSAGGYLIKSIIWNLEEKHSTYGERHYSFDQPGNLNIAIAALHSLKAYYILLYLYFVISVSTYLVAQRKRDLKLGVALICL